MIYCYFILDQLNKIDDGIQKLLEEKLTMLRALQVNRGRVQSCKTKLLIFKYSY